MLEKFLEIIRFILRLVKKYRQITKNEIKYKRILAHEYKKWTN